MDGIDHINVYSKGKTELGRLLSNFAETPFELFGGVRFKTVEGFWYFTITGEGCFSEMSGWECKELGKKLPALRGHPTKEELKKVYEIKLKANPGIEKLLRENKLPLKHYYVYGNKVVEPKEWQWTAELWNEL